MPMPLVLKASMVLGAVMGLLTGLVCIAFLNAAWMGIGPYTVQGSAVSRGEFMAFAVPALLGQATLCAFGLGAAWGLFRRRYWARPLLMGMGLASTLFYLAGGLVVGLPWGRLALTLSGGALTLLMLWWILYRRDDVVDWFEALRPER